MTGLGLGGIYVLVALSYTLVLAAGEIQLRPGGTGERRCRPRLLARESRATSPCCSSVALVMLAGVVFGVVSN